MKVSLLPLLLLLGVMLDDALCSPSPTWVTPLFRYRRHPQQGGDDGEDVVDAAAAAGDAAAAAEGGAADDGSLDLHTQEFCVDVSTYGPVKFEAETREKCDTVFNKRCETKTDQVCDEVTEIQCDIVPYTECQMSMEATPYNSFEMVSKNYFRKECTEGMDTVQHTKMMPECKNVTKQNCITKWEEDENGNQVWAGNEACEPVTWRECKLVPRQVDFKVPKVDCVEGEAIPYTDCEDTEKVQMTTRMTCEVRHTTDCRPVVSTKCQTLEYQECQEEPEERCEEREVMVPTQEKEHKKKCLLPDDGSFAGSASSTSAASASGAASAAGGATRSARVGKSIQARGANGKPQLQSLQRLGGGERQGSASRHHRTFTGSAGRPRVGSSSRSGRRAKHFQQQQFQQHQQQFHQQHRFQN